MMITSTNPMVYTDFPDPDIIPGRGRVLHGHYDYAFHTRVRYSAQL